jgi:hypothetical protein
MLPIIDAPASPVVRGLLNTLVFVFSLFLLERSSDVFVDSTAIVAKRFRIPPILVGLLTAGAEWEEVCPFCILHLLDELTVTKLAVVVSSLINKNPSLALSNIYGSTIANILGSFSIGLLFSPNPLSGAEQLSARIYTSLAVGLSVIIAVISTLEYGHIRLGRGWVRGIGGCLIGVFAVYIAGIAFGIYRGVVIAPEDSDSDSDSDDGDNESDTSEESQEAVPRLAAPSECI